MGNLCIKYKTQILPYLPKTIRCTMLYISHQFLLNKLLSTTNIAKNYTVCNISWSSNSLEKLLLKKTKKKLITFYCSNERLKNDGSKYRY